MGRARCGAISRVRIGEVVVLVVSPAHRYGNGGTYLLLVFNRASVSTALGVFWWKQIIYALCLGVWLCWCRSKRSSWS